MLADWPKNTNKDKAISEAIMREMASWPVNMYSRCWTDRNRKLLLAYFADHIEKVGSFSYIPAPALY
jgi:tartrate dehydratase alpha subunit/fumarate hydratase class I-like protein